MTENAHANGESIDALDELSAGDKVLWGERKRPMTVARVVDEDDRVGQTLTASVVRNDPNYDRPGAPNPDELERPLKKGDVFLPATNERTLTGREFVLDTPAPWNTPDDMKPANDVIKSTPWNSVHYEWDDERTAWVVDENELPNLSSLLASEGYIVEVAESVRDE
jgi:hypothetical protein